MNLFSHWKSKKKLNRDGLIDALWGRFTHSPHHKWILQDEKLFRVFYSFFQLVDTKSLYILLANKELVYIRAIGRLSCTLTTIENAHIVLIFPELQRYLKSAAPEYGMAILAHELGHILCQHSEKELDVIQAQIEADLYACHLGLGQELLETLALFKQSEECLIRSHKIRAYLKHR